MKKFKRVVWPFGIFLIKAVMLIFSFQLSPKEFSLHQDVCGLFLPQSGVYLVPVALLVKSKPDSHSEVRRLSRTCKLRLPPWLVHCIPKVPISVFLRLIVWHFYGTWETLCMLSAFSFWTLFNWQISRRKEKTHYKCKKKKSKKKIKKNSSIVFRTVMQLELFFDAGLFTHPVTTTLMLKQVFPAALNSSSL